VHVQVKSRISYIAPQHFRGTTFNPFTIDLLPSNSLGDQQVDIKTLAFNNFREIFIGNDFHLFCRFPFTVLPFPVCGSVMVSVFSNNQVQDAIAKKFIPLPLIV
jgi:hypothetical protein